MTPEWRTLLLAELRRRDYRDALDEILDVADDLAGATADSTAPADLAQFAALLYAAVAQLEPGVAP